MKRRNVLLSAVALLAAPVAVAKASAAAVSSGVHGRFKIKAYKDPGSSWLDGFYTEKEVADNRPEDQAMALSENCPGTDWPKPELVDAEYIPTSRWLVYIVPTSKVSEMTGPLDVPNHWGDHGWSHDTVNLPLSDEALSKDEAIKKTIALNRRHMAEGADRWAVAVELAEPQGRCMYSLECGPEAVSLVVVTKFLPARIYRDGMKGAEV